ncbi:MAG: hypothetical protein ACJ8AX_08020, partial [Gemmatimonadales bacterium]
PSAFIEPFLFMVVVAFFAPVVDGLKPAGRPPYRSAQQMIGCPIKKAVTPNFPDAHTRWGPESPNFGYPSRE